MSKNEISSTDAGLLLEKLVRESVPVVAFFISPDGVRSKFRGFVDSVTSGTGITVASKQGSPAETGYLSVLIGNPAGTGCTFVFGDIRELPEEKREESANKLGEAALSISLPTGARLTLFFTP